MASVFKGMRFCRECDNMLQPVEERLDTGESSRLVYKCRICGHRDPAIPGSEQDHCVYRSSDPASGAAEGGGQGDFFFAVDKERDVQKVPAQGGRDVHEPHERPDQPDLRMHPMHLLLAKGEG
jgi:hypothetical protein